MKRTQKERSLNAKTLFDNSLKHNKIEYGKYLPLTILIK